MSSPIDRMIDAVAMTPLPASPHEGGGLYATHEGRLTVGAFTFRVYQLSDGQRVIDADDVERFFCGDAPGREPDE